MSLSTLTPLKNDCSQGRIEPMTKELLLGSTWNKDAAGAWP